ncbi:MAG: tetratricopeptide repeat protein [Tolypothrix sp. Co-bin9]|nr:tetratricopeptide repeat protein [Tolypothrix sp. Co-bin9]
MKEQLARQTEAARDLLCRMCVLRVGIDVKGLTFLRLYTDDVDKDNRFEIAADLGQPAKFTEIEISETEAILDRLVDSSLVQRRYDEKKCELFYELHRVIVEFLQTEYQDEMPNLLKIVYKFYSSGKNVENAKTLEDLRPVLEAQYFAFELGEYSQAWSLLTSRLYKYLQVWGNWNLLKDLYEQILFKLNAEQHPHCLARIGVFYYQLGNWDIAERYLQNAVSKAQEQEDKHSIVLSLSWLGCIERDKGNWNTAKQMYQQCIELCQELGERSNMAQCLAMLGGIESYHGNWDTAESLYQESLLIKKEVHDHYGIASITHILGRNELGRGNLDAAEGLLKDALTKMQILGMTWDIATANYSLARLERQRGDTEVAQQHYNTAHQMYQQLRAAKDLEKIEQEWKSS